jgi:hypothetical protein
MTTIDNHHRLTHLVKDSPGRTLHLIVDNNQRGIVFFACEQAPLVTFKSHGLPARCPICCTQNPLKGRTG